MSNPNRRPVPYGEFVRSPVLWREPPEVECPEKDILFEQARAFEHKHAAWIEDIGSVLLDHIPDELDDQCGQLLIRLEPIDRVLPKPGEIHLIRIFYGSIEGKFVEKNPPCEYFFASTFDFGWYCVGVLLSHCRLLKHIRFAYRDLLLTKDELDVLRDKELQLSSFYETPCYFLLVSHLSGSDLLWTIYVSTSEVQPNDAPWLRVRIPLSNWNDAESNQMNADDATSVLSADLTLPFIHAWQLLVYVHSTNLYLPIFQTNLMYGEIGFNDRPSLIEIDQALADYEEELGLSGADTI